MRMKQEENIEEEEVMEEEKIHKQRKKTREKTKKKKRVPGLIPFDQEVTDVRWEDIVKGSQMEERHIRLSKVNILTNTTTQETFLT